MRPRSRSIAAATGRLPSGSGNSRARCNFSVWVRAIGYLRASGKRPSTLKRVIVGGAACPRTMIEVFQDEFGVEVRHAWGMTEMSPLGTIGTLKAKHQALPADAQARLQAKQGRPVFGGPRAGRRDEPQRTVAERSLGRQVPNVLVTRSACPTGQ